MIFKRGHYITRCGMQAVVAQVKSVEKSWVLQGAVNDGNDVLYIHTWTIQGRSVVSTNFDLVRSDN